MRRSTILMGLITCIIGGLLFQLKYEVMGLEAQYKNICYSIRSAEESISILKAEWAHLTSPDRLQKLAQKHLGIEQVTQKQLVSFQRLTPLDQPKVDIIADSIAIRAPGARSGTKSSRSIADEDVDMDNLISELIQQDGQ